MRACGTERLADLGSCARVCRMLMDSFNVPFAEVAESFALDPVIVFSGHLFDQAGRAKPRFPVALEEEAATAIREAMAEFAEPICFCSLSWGADMLFAEAVLAKPGAVLHIVLGASPEVCCESSVKSPAGPLAEEWVGRYEAILAKAASVKAVAQTERPEAVDYVYANRVLQGLALLRGRQLQREVMGIALWDGIDSPEKGGTADFLRHFRTPDGDLRIISPFALNQKGAAPHV